MWDMGRASWMRLEKRLILRNGKAEYKRGEKGKKKGERKPNARPRQEITNVVYYILT
jgi:hypothetical protein